jgi:hypothetical protein
VSHKFPTNFKVMAGERYDRFVAMTQRMAALDDVKNFEKAFQKALKDALENASGRRGSTTNLSSRS